MDVLEYASPLGAIVVLAVNDGIAALFFADQKYVTEHALSVRKMEGGLSASPAFPYSASALGRAGTSAAWLDAARRWLDAYFSGVPDPSRPPLCPPGTAYQCRVWRELLTIPWGGTVSYKELAERCGGSARSAANAAARNPVSLLIPCHRVVGTDGSLTGYAGGLDRKRKLLELEQGVPLESEQGVSLEPEQGVTPQPEQGIPLESEEEQKP